MSFAPIAGRRPAIVLALLLVGCAIALSLQVRRPHGETVAQRWALDLFGFGIQGVSEVRSWLQEAREWASNHRRLVDRNRDLENRVIGLEKELLALRDAERERQRLVALHAAHPSVPGEARVCKMIALSSSGPFRSALLDRGRAEGIEVGGVVVTAQGLLGRVVALGERTARVQLLSDRLAAVGVLLPRSGRIAVGKGNGMEGLAVEYVPVRADVNPGDVVLTSGTDGVYPRDLPVGVIEGVNKGGASLFLDLPVRLRANPEHASVVYVLPPQILVREAETDVLMGLPAGKGGGRSLPAGRPR